MGVQQCLAPHFKAGPRPSLLYLGRARFPSKKNGHHWATFKAKFWVHNMERYLLLLATQPCNIYPWAYQLQVPNFCYDSFAIQYIELSKLHWSWIGTAQPMSLRDSHEHVFTVEILYKKHWSKYKMIEWKALNNISRCAVNFHKRKI